MAKQSTWILAGIGGFVFFLLCGIGIFFALKKQKETPVEHPEFEKVVDEELESDEVLLSQHFSTLSEALQWCQAQPSCSGCTVANGSTVYSMKGYKKKQLTKARPGILSFIKKKMSDVEKLELEQKFRVQNQTDVASDGPNEYEWKYATDEEAKRACLADATCFGMVKVGNMYRKKGFVNARVLDNAPGYTFLERTVLPPVQNKYEETVEIDYCPNLFDRYVLPYPNLDAAKIACDLDSNCSGFVYSSQTKKYSMKPQKDVHKCIAISDVYCTSYNKI